MIRKEAWRPAVVSPGVSGSGKVRGGVAYLSGVAG